ncbi:MAG TPA: Fur family transcriptional regulator [Syntrophobacteraceae bacterium]|nr:Fur family transcriptional regulator [Syntrophobacteraceae bacterium]
MEGKNDKDFIATLRERGLQVTYQRLAIYQALYFTREHPSAEVIYQQVKKRFPMISLGTVYKTLERFYEVGLIQKVSPMTEVARYDAITDPHHHMVCVECQSIHDASLAEEPAIKVSEQDGFRIMRQQVVVHGYCPACKGDTDCES